MARKKLLHIKSASIDNGAPKLPTANQIEYGEIAVNYGNGVETLSIKNSANEIVTFTNDKTLLAYIDEQDNELATAAGLSTTASTGPNTGVTNFEYVADGDDYYLSAATSLFNADQVLSKAVLENERVTAEALNDLNTRVNNVSGSVTTVQSSLDSLSQRTDAAIDDIYDTIENLDAIDVDDTLNKDEKTEGDKKKYVLSVKIDNALDLTSKYPVANSAISTVIKEDEEVIAAALNDLNTRVGEVSGSVSSIESITDGIDDDLDYLSGQIDTNTASITGLGQSKQDKLTAGTGIDITENVISCTLDTEVSEFVNALPASGSTSKIYFVPNADTGATPGNTYIEYAWHMTGVTQAEGEWEKLGEWTPSLTIDEELDLDSANPVQNAAISSAMTRIELATSSALNDLNTRTSEISDNVSTISGDVDTLKTRVANTYTKPEIDAMVDDLEITIDDTLNSGSTNPLANSAITANFDRVEKVTAASLNDLNNKALELSADTTSLKATVSGIETAVDGIETAVDGMEPLVVTATASTVTIGAYSAVTVTNGVSYSDAYSALNDGRCVLLKCTIMGIDIMFDFNGIINQTLVGDNIGSLDMIGDSVSTKVDVSLKWTQSNGIQLGLFYTEPEVVFDINNQILSTDGNTAITLSGSDIKLTGYNSPINNTDSDPIRTGDTVDQAFSKVISAITDNEEVTSAALNDLDARITTVSGDLQTLIDNPVEPMAEVTYSELVALKNGGELAAGSWYRITDYQCTTTQTGTSSANHPFDIIVLALSNNTLSEEARAIQHAGDTYFAKSKLNAWQLKYSLENDKVKYGWADTVNGKGVVWYMKDEWNNECGYDFKNIMFTRALTNGALDKDNGTNTSVYTFNGYLGGNQIDLSNGIDLAVAGGNGYVTMCAENIIKSWYDYGNQTSIVQGNGLMLLNDNVFLCSANNIGEIQNLYVFGNVFEQSCYQNTLHGFAEKNVFGENCEDNTFGTNCGNNTFGNNCDRNTFGNNCVSNTFGNNCDDNSFGYNCVGNTFGFYCGNNTFGESCYRNTFWNDCSGNAFGTSCSNNMFGNNCASNTFGTNCGNNTFGNQCLSNTFGNSCSSNVFGDSCLLNRFGTGTATINYVRYIQVENGVLYADITTTATTSSSAYLQNITISQGVSGTDTTHKTISHPTVGDTFQTIYRPANSQIVSV